MTGITEFKKQTPRSLPFKDQKVPMLTGISAALTLSQQLWNWWLDSGMPSSAAIAFLLPFCFHSAAYQVGRVAEGAFVSRLPSKSSESLCNWQKLFHIQSPSGQGAWVMWYLILGSSEQEAHGKVEHSLVNQINHIHHGGPSSPWSYKFRLEILTICPEFWVTIFRKIIFRYTYLLLGSILVVCLYLLYQPGTPNASLSARI